ncbi:MAG TPA: calcium-binding protein, partial [Pirellulales bacterium]|nr:calcium-binding protein [Pirellulales bacterium]
MLFGSDGSESGTDSDILYGGAGDDLLVGAGGDDQLYGGDGNDYLYGEAGNNYLDGGAGNDYLFGSDPDASGTGSNIIYGGTGDDLLIGAGGDDQLYGGTGADYLYGEAGNDYLDGGDGNDYLFGGNGDGQGAGNDILHGGAGNDYLVGSDGNDQVYGEAGDDILFGENGDDTLDGGDGVNSLYGQAGNDTDVFNPATLSSATDYIDEAGNADSDTLDFSAFTDGITVDLSSTSAQPIDNANSSLLSLTLYENNGVENTLGGSGNDTLTGNTRDNYLFGGDGDDTLSGGDGNDFLEGGKGNDSLTGGDGDDTYIFNPANSSTGLLGSDTITESANTDSDTLDFSNFTDDIIVYLNTTSSQTVDSGVLSLTLSSDTGIENVGGSSGQNTITGNSRDNILDGRLGTTDSLIGNAGNDILYGGSGDDTLEGDAGNDVLYGGDGSDTLHGNDGNDFLYGQDGDDHLYGDAGDDRLEGGTGDDDLHGGTGDDTYVYRWNSGEDSLGSDTIDDNTSENNKLDFSNFYATDYARPDPTDTSDSQIVSDDQISIPVDDGDDPIFTNLLEIKFSTADTINTFTDPNTFTTSVAGVAAGQTDADTFQLFAYGVQGTNDHPVTSVNFYDDVNNDGILDSGDQLVGTDTDGSDGWSTDLTYDDSQQSWTYDDGGSPTPIPSNGPDTQLFAAAANDDGGGTPSDPATINLAMIVPPPIAAPYLKRQNNDYGIADSAAASSSGTTVVGGFPISDGKSASTSDHQRFLAASAEPLQGAQIPANILGDTGSATATAATTAVVSGDKRVGSNIFSFDVSNSNAIASVSGSNGAFTQAVAGTGTGLPALNPDYWDVYPGGNRQNASWDVVISGTITFYWVDPVLTTGAFADSATGFSIQLTTSDGAYISFQINADNSSTGNPNPETAGVASSGAGAAIPSEIWKVNPWLGPTTVPFTFHITTSQNDPGWISIQSLAHSQNVSAT